MTASWLYKKKPVEFDATITIIGPSKEFDERVAKYAASHPDMPIEMVKNFIEENWAKDWSDDVYAPL